MSVRDILLISVGVNEYQSLQSLGFCSSDSKQVVKAFEKRADIRSIELNDEKTPPNADDC